MKKITLLLIALFTVIFLADCKKKKTSEEDQPEDSFDKSGMLANYADNVILPNLQTAKNSLDSLALAFTAFTQNKTTVSLNALRQAYTRAYSRYQHVSLFEFGPSENEIIRANFDTYPTDTVHVNSNIAAGTYDLSQANNISAKGFPAIDFLLYGKNMSDASIVALFDTDANAANRVAYVSNCLSDMQSKLNNVINSWNSGYRGTFVSSTGSDIGSSLGYLINQLNFEIDLMKNAKVGIPLGKKSLGVQLPEKCEAVYTNTISVKLIKECLSNIEDTYLGRSASGSDGLGIDDYLDAVKAQHTSGSLNDAIKSQFAITRSKLALVNEPLSVSVVSDAATVDAAYVEMVKLLVLLKTDAPSALGIVITYQDGDGD